MQAEALERAGISTREAVEKVQEQAELISRMSEATNVMKERLAALESKSTEVHATPCIMREHQGKAP